MVRLVPIVKLQTQLNANLWLSCLCAKIAVQSAPFDVIINRVVIKPLHNNVDLILLIL